MSNYGIKVDKKILTEFFQIPLDRVTAKHLKEIDKVFAIVMAKWFAKWYYLAEDLKGFAHAGICQRHDSFDIERGNAYNYIFSYFRNEIGNKIKTLTREVATDSECNEEYNVNVIRALSYTMEDLAALPPEIEKYKDYLLGIKPFSIIRIPKKDLLPLLLFFKAHEPMRVNVPTFIKNQSNNVEVLYKTMKDLIELNYE